MTGTAPGDSVKVWFTGGGATSDSFTYRVESDSGRRVLIVAAGGLHGRVAGLSRARRPPQYLSFYTDALTANGVAFDVYDVDAHGRTAPDNLGVLSHYDAVVWYTGNDVVTREPGWGPATPRGWRCRSCSRCATSSTTAGACSTRASAPGSSTRRRSARSCTTRSRTAVPRRPGVAGALPRAVGLGQLAGRPDRVHVRRGDHHGRAAGSIRTPAIRSTSTASTTRSPGLSWGFNGADSAQNQTTNSSFIATGDFLKVTDPAASFPQFESWPAAEYRSGLAGPFDPHTGQSFMWSQRADEAYKRLSRTITVPAGGATMSFWTSYNLELDFDYLIVEAHTVGQDDWTTLPDLNGHTSSDLSNDQSCTGGWSNPADAGQRAAPVPDALPDVRPATGTCSTTGTSGEWNAANGASAAGSSSRSTSRRFAGQQVEVSITSLSDWGLQQFPGVFIDDIVVSTGEGSTSFEDDGDPMDGWTVPGAPQDADGIEGPNPQRLGRRGGLGIKEGAASRPPTRSTWASASRASPAPRPAGRPGQRSHQPAGADGRALSPYSASAEQHLDEDLVERSL